MTTVEIPLFPLNTVLFPGGVLPLRIFEPRYIDMVSQCLRNERGFGVCLIRAGEETGQAATVHEHGTVAMITDWQQRDDGLLGITAVGVQRFRSVSHRVQDDQLLVAEVDLLAPEPVLAIPDDCQPVVAVLRELIRQFGRQDGDAQLHYDDPAWVGCRLAELLPIPLSRKQYYLELTDPLLRLQQLGEVVRELVAE